ncbi:DUF7439 family protein [Cellulomonas sp. Marseille-Q8402]
MTLYALLPAAWRPYAKTVVAALGTVLSVLAVTLTAVPPWVAVATNLLTALGVWGVPNRDAIPLAAPTDADGDARRRAAAAGADAPRFHP